MAKVKVAQLVFDHTVYPRTDIDSYHVNELFHALQSGTRLPPPLVDKTTLRIVDGFHRTQAHIKHFGANSKIDVHFRTFKNDAELFKVATELNSSHGKRFTRIDQTRVVQRGRELGLADKTISGLLHITPQRAQKLTDQGLTANGLDILRPSMRQFAGKTLTAEQKEVNIHAGGLHQTAYINIVCNLIESDSLDWHKPNVVKAVMRLKKLLQKVNVKAA